MCTHVHMYKKSHILPRTKTKRGLSIGSHLNESEGRGEILDPPGEDLAKCCARRCSTYCLMSSGSRVVRENRAAGRLCSPEPGKGSADGTVSRASPRGLREGQPRSLAPRCLPISLLPNPKELSFQSRLPFILPIRPKIRRKGFGGQHLISLSLGFFFFFFSDIQAMCHFLCRCTCCWGISYL